VKLVKRSVIIHGGKEVFVLIPLDINEIVIAGHDNLGSVLIWGNDSGYRFLAECFSISAELLNNEILYLPLKQNTSKGFNERFHECEYNYSIICTNYCETQLSPKEIEAILKIKVWTEEIINRTPKINTEYIDHWKAKRRLTVKIHKKNMYISTNRHGYHSLTCGANDLMEYEGKTIEDFIPHRHFDWEENTSTSVGVTLYYIN
jgi:hypothetical protein